jgi:hypothetical protein
LNFNKWSVTAIWNTGGRYVALHQGNAMSQILMRFVRQNIVSTCQDGNTVKSSKFRDIDVTNEDSIYSRNLASISLFLAE